MAQHSISGTFQDENDAPVEYLQVAAFVEDSLVSTAMTDEKGAFSLTLVTGTYVIAADLFGTSVYRDTLAVNESIDLGIIPVNTQVVLETIIVTEEKKAIDQNYNTLTFNVQNTPLKSGYNGMEVLRYAPKIQADSEGNLSIRNLPPTVMVNGKTLNLSGSALTNYISSLDSEQIEKIEIATTADVSADATSQGGTINIILNKSRPGLSTTLRGWYYQYHKKLYNTAGFFNFRYGSEKWSIYGRYGLKDVTTFAIATSDVRPDNGGMNESISEFDSHQTVQGTNLAAIYELSDKHEIGGEIQGLFSGRIVDGQSTLLNSLAMLPDTGQAESERDIGTKEYNLSFNYKWTMDTLGSTLKFIADYAENGRIENYTVSTIYAGIDNNQENYLTDSDTRILTVQIDGTKRFASKAQLVTGLKYTQIDRLSLNTSQTYQNEVWVDNIDRTSTYDYDENIAAAYASFSTSIADKYQIKVGLRAENSKLNGIEKVSQDTIQKNFLNWFPNVFAKTNISEKASLSFNYGRSTQRPRFRALTAYIIKTNDLRYLIGNPRLQPEFIHKLELNYNRPKQDVGLYHNIYEQPINDVYFLEDEAAYHQYQNTGKLTETGIEYNYYGKLRKWWYTNTSASVAHQIFRVPDYHSTNVAFSIKNYSSFTLDKKTGIDLDVRLRTPSRDSYFLSATQFKTNIIFKRTFFEDKRLSMRLSFNDIFNTVRDKSNAEFPFFDFYFHQKRETQVIGLLIAYKFKVNAKTKINNKKIKSANDARQRL